MEEKIKSILSLYIKLPAEQIVAQTIIDRSAVESSILLHRMYAHLLKEKISITNYWDIKTYNDLVSQIIVSTTPLISGDSQLLANDYNNALNNTNSFIGIDIEEIDQLPGTNNYREEEFYVMNFSSSEIAYCILKPNPIISFTGLFAAKEAIIKADNSFASKPFNTIIIDHLPGGTPIFPSFQLSISHTNSIAVAIAIKKNSTLSDPINITTFSSQLSNSKNSSYFLILVLITTGLSLIATLIALMK